MLDRMIRAARLDASLYEEVEADPSSMGQAMAVVVLASLAGGIGTAGIEGQPGFILGVLLNLIGWYVWAFLTYVIGTKLLPQASTEADVGQLLRTIGFAAAPGLLRVVGFIPGIGQLVMLAAGGTAATFFGLATVATTTRRDFSFLGNFLMVGVIVAMLAVLANIFLASPVLHLVICGVFVVLSSMLILYQLNAVVNGGETNYVSATLSIYVAVYNLFTSLLQILMAVGGQRE